MIAIPTLFPFLADPLRASIQLAGEYTAVKLLLNQAQKFIQDGVGEESVLRPNGYAEEECHTTQNRSKEWADEIERFHRYLLGHRSGCIGGQVRSGFWCENVHLDETNVSSFETSRKLSAEEIVGQCLIFLRDYLNSMMIPKPDDIELALLRDAFPRESRGITAEIDRWSWLFYSRVWGSHDNFFLTDSWILAIEMDHLADLKYMDAVIKESLRHYHENLYDL